MRVNLVMRDKYIAKACGRTPKANPVLATGGFHITFLFSFQRCPESCRWTVRAFRTRPARRAMFPPFDFQRKFSSISSMTRRYTEMPIPLLQHFPGIHSLRHVIACPVRPRLAQDGLSRTTDIPHPTWHADGWTSSLPPRSSRGVLPHRASEKVGECTN